jgi:putative SOS response-associated peptidase YedK
MCNLYSVTKGQQAIREWFRVSHDRTGNMPPLPGTFPDTLAPVVRRSGDGERELVMMRWGLICPSVGLSRVASLRQHMQGYAIRR